MISPHHGWPSGTTLHTLRRDSLRAAVPETSWRSAWLRRGRTRGPVDAAPDLRLTALFAAAESGDGAAFAQAALGLSTDGTVESGLQAVGEIVATEQATGRHPRAARLGRAWLTALVGVGRVRFPEASLARRRLAESCLALSRYSEAEVLLKADLKTHIRNVGPAAPPVLRSQLRLAKCWRIQGEAPRAEALFQETLAAARAIGETADPEYGDVFNDLAELLAARGAVADAWAFCLRALVLQKQKLDRADVRVMRTRNNLGALARLKGDLPAAEQLFLKNLTLARAAVPPDQPFIATCANNLAEVYRPQGRYAAAEPLLIAALDIRRRHCGPDHVLTAQSLGALASLRLSQHRPQAAAILYEELLALRQRTLPPDHPDQASALVRLAEACARTQRLLDAEAALAAARRIYAAHFPPLHPRIVEAACDAADLFTLRNRWGDAARILNPLEAALAAPDSAPAATRARLCLSLARWRRSQREFPEARGLLASAADLQCTAEDASLELAVIQLEQARTELLCQSSSAAEPFLEQALAIRQTRLEPEHPAIAEILIALAEVRLRQDDAETAARLCTRAGKLLQQAPETAVATLIQLDVLQGDAAERLGAEDVAETHRRRELGRYDAQPVPDLAGRAAVLHKLASALFRQNYLFEAEEFWRRSLADYQKLRTRPTDLARVQACLGRVQARLDRAEAEQTLQVSLPALERAVGPEHEDVADLLEDYAALLRKTDRATRAKDLSRRADQIRNRSSHVLSDLL